MRKVPSVLNSRAWVAIVLTVVFLIFFLVLLLRDIGPVDDSDLAIMESEVKPGENPWPELHKLKFSKQETERLKMGAAMLRPGGELDLKQVESLLLEFGPELERYERYADMTGWQAERRSYMLSVDTSWTEWLLLTQLKKVEAAYQRAQGECWESVKTGLDIIGFGKGVLEAGGLLLDGIVGITFAFLGHQVVVEALEVRDLDEGQLVQLAKELDEMEFPVDFYKNILLHEYGYQKSLLELIEQAPEVPAEIFFDVKYPILT